jgi:hypothetical protein
MNEEKYLREAFDKLNPNMSEEDKNSWFKAAQNDIKQLNFSYDETIEAIQIAYEEGQPKWISVDEKLPDRRGNYVVYYNYGNANGVVSNFSISQFYLGKWYDDNADFSIEKHDLFEYKNTEGYCKITHWAPLPPKPEQRETI